MVATIPVSYGMIIGYVSFVVVSTLLVGLLPPLVNLPECNYNESSVADIKIEAAAVEEYVDYHANVPYKHHRPQVAVKEEPLHVRQKRQIEAREPFALSYSRLMEQLPTNPWLAERMIVDAPTYPNLTICEEILQPVQGMIYPWMNPRLPNYIQPVNYKMEILLSNINFDVYNGFVNVTFNLNQSTNLFLFHHAKNDVPLVQYLVDKDDAIVPVDCIGLYSDDKNDYYVLRTTNFLQPNQGPFTINFIFFDYYTGIDDGVFKIKYDSGTNSSLIASKFQPISARKSFPCFDEPSYKATYDITIYHRDDFYAISNSPIMSSAPDPVPGVQDTIFETTPPLPTYFVAFATFSKNDFDFVTRNISNNITLTIYARKQFITEGFADDPADMCVKIFNEYLDIFKNVNSSALPKKIDILAIPEYETDAVSHFGFPIFEEDKILFKSSTASERDKQEIGLRIARVFAQFWFGNFITPSFWDQLWIQEGFADYFKYRALNQAYANWNVLGQFITDELIGTLIYDGYPTTHPVQKPITNPYEIEEYFDVIESTKVAAILRMYEKEAKVGPMYQAITNFLNANPWGVADLHAFYVSLPNIGNWPASDFFDRWTLQPNRPLVIAELVDNGALQSVILTQYRGLNTNYSLFGGELELYPSPWNFTWYIPVECSFGNGTSPLDTFRQVEFYLDTHTAMFAAPFVAGTKWTWIHCDRQFNGYFELDYTKDNWKLLGDVMKQQTPEFTPEDRAQILHNFFLNAYTERGNYFQLVEMLDYLPLEQDFLPWKVVDFHVSRMDSILQYRQTFGPVSAYFGASLRAAEAAFDIWSPGGSHVQELLKETIINLACRLQEPFCIKNATQLWGSLVSYLVNGNFSDAPIPAYARKVIYEYHIQNTYDVSDFDLILKDYEILLDQSEHKKLLSSLTFSRLPWLLTSIVGGINTDYVRKVDFFEILKYLSFNPLGRDIAWSYYRTNYNDLLIQYGEDDPRLGQALLDITDSFEINFLFYELLYFVLYNAQGATANARYKALEIVSTNIIWLADKEEEIAAAFSSPRRGGGVSINRNPLLVQPAHRFDATVFARLAHELIDKAFAETRADVFSDFLIKTLRKQY